MDCIRLNGYEKKKLSKNNARLRGLAPDFVGSEAVFEVDAFKVAEVNVLSNRFFSLRTSRITNPIQTFGLDRTKESFHGRFVIGTSRAGNRRTKVLSFVRSKYAEEVYYDPCSLWRESPPVTFSVLRASRIVCVTSDAAILLLMR